MPLTSPPSPTRKFPWPRAKRATRCANSCGTWRREEARRATESWQKAIAAQEAPLSTRARDLLALEVSKEMELMRREERSCFREFARLTRDLMKVQKAGEVRDQKSVKDPKQQSQSQDAGAGDEAVDRRTQK